MATTNGDLVQAGIRTLINKQQIKKKKKKGGESQWGGIWSSKQGKVNPAELKLEKLFLSEQETNKYARLNAQLRYLTQ